MFVKTVLRLFVSKLSKKDKPKPLLFDSMAPNQMSILFYFICGTVK